MANLQEGDLVLCTVERIDNTSVFVRCSDNTQGTIVTSEIAPGRIRNIREHVMPNKRIVCKVLRVSPNSLDLSLRRVTSKEKEELMEQFKLENTLKSALKSILKEEAGSVEQKILTEFESLGEFFNKARENEELISKYFSKEISEQIKKITQKRKKEVEIKKLVKIKCLEFDGIKRIKEIFSENDNDIETIYLSAGNFQIRIKDEDYKKANQKMNAFLEEIEKKSKKLVCEYSVEDHNQK